MIWFLDRRLPKWTTESEREIKIKVALNTLHTVIYYNNVLQAFTQLLNQESHQNSCTR